MPYLSLFAFALAVACLAGAVSGSGDHGHPEYLALYSLAVGGSHTLQFEGAGEETSIEFMMVPSSSADHEGLEEAEEASATGEFSSVLLVCMRQLLNYRNFKSAI